MPAPNRHDTVETLHNKAQEERHAADNDVKRLTDTPEIEGGEAWTQTSGMTFGPRALLWTGTGLFITLGLYSITGHIWTDYVHDTRQNPEGPTKPGNTRRHQPMSQSHNPLKPVKPLGETVQPR